MIRITNGALITVVTCFTLCAQDIKIPLNLDKLAQRAKESVDVTLDASLLQLASGFLSKNNADEAKVKKMIANLKGVYVRSFEFDKEGAYTAADVDYIRSQFNGPGWEHIANVRSKREGSYDVVMMYEGSVIRGLGVLAAEPRALTVVNVIGAIDLTKLRDLEGNFGIPRFGLEQVPGVTVQDNRKDKKPQDEPKKPQ